MIDCNWGYKVLFFGCRAPALIRSVRSIGSTRTQALLQLTWPKTPPQPRTDRIYQIAIVVCSAHTFGYFGGKLTREFRWDRGVIFCSSACLRRRCWRGRSPDSSARGSSRPNMVNFADFSLTSPTRTFPRWRPFWVCNTHPYWEGSCVSCPLPHPWRNGPGCGLRYGTAPRAHRGYIPKRSLKCKFTFEMKKDMF